VPAVLPSPPAQRCWEKVRAVRGPGWRRCAHVVYLAAPPALQDRCRGNRRNKALVVLRRTGDSEAEVLLRAA
jgi:hypothetical protein